MTILISGVAGFIGSNFAHWLLENTNHEIIGIDNLSSGYKDNLPKHERFTYIFCNVTHSGDLDRIFAGQNPHVCYHLAAYAAEGRSNYIRNFIHSNNTVGTANFINCCVNYNCKLIFTSSVAVYSGTPPFTESLEPNPIDEYGLSKWTSERSIQIAGETQGLNWCIIRPRNVYGERQSLWDTARNVMGIWMNQILNDKPITIYGDGLQKRNFTYINDILEPLYNAIEVHNEVINLGSEKAYKVVEVATYLCHIANYNNILFLEPRHEVKEATCDIYKSQQLLKFEQKTPLYKGIERMWVWAENQHTRPFQIPPKLEITKNTHSSII